MSLLKRREKTSVDRRQSLAGIPALDPEVQIAPRDGTTVFLKTKIRRGDGFLDRFRPPVMDKSYELDEFGTFVVQQMDGKRSVMLIIDAFQGRFGMSRREAELGVVAFIKMLMHRGLAHVGIK